MFGTGYLLDGSHPEIKLEPHHFSPVATERTRGEFTFVKQRGFKRRPRVTHHSRVSMVKTQECAEQELKFEGRPSGGSHVSDASASSKGAKGSRARRRKPRRSQKVVFNRSGVISQTSPSDMMKTVSNVTAANVSKPVLSYAKQGVREVPRESRLVKSQAAAGQCKVLLVPADGEQQGRVKAQDQQGHSEAHAISKSSG